ncbi:MAG: hypothetical protein ACRD1Z_08995 [Vicinamibacteria bacterium]
MAEIDKGNLKILNVTKTLAAATEESFSFRVPPGGIGLMKEATYHLKRSVALSPANTPAAGQTNDVFTSEDIIIKSLEVVKQGASERVNLLSGNPNIKEFAGNGQLSKLFTVIETLENNEDVVCNIRNDDLVSVRVSITLWMAVKPRERRIAAQPGAERVPASAEV